jgi:hypothetical protein
MLIAEDLLLLLTDDVTGEPAVDSERLTSALAGSVLVELVLANRLTVTRAGGWGSGSQVAVVDRTPLGDPLLDEALERAAARRQPVAAQSLLPVLGKGLADSLRSRLAARGILRAKEGRMLGIFPTRVWPAADSRHEAQLRTALWEVVVRGRDPRPNEACLVSLLHALNEVPKQFRADGVTPRQLRARAAALAEGNIGGEAVRRAVEAADAAVVAVTTVAIVGGASS